MTKAVSRAVLSLALFFLLYGSDAQKRKLKAQAHTASVRRKMPCRRPRHRLHAIGGHRQGHSVSPPKQLARRGDAHQG